MLRTMERQKLGFWSDLTDLPLTFSIKSDVAGVTTAAVSAERVAAQEATGASIKTR